MSLIFMACSRWQPSLNRGGLIHRSWPALCRPSTNIFPRDSKSPCLAGGYIMTNRPNGTLYVGVTDDLARRAWEHRAGLLEGFNKQYGLRRLVYAERYDDMRLARQRERNLKHWRRSWKDGLILAQNP